MKISHEIRFMPVNQFMQSDEVPRSWEVSPTSWRKLRQLYDCGEVRSRSDAERIGGLGGGTAIDRAKVAAWRYGYDCVAIPSMVSTNVFATNKSAVIVGDKKVTVDSVLPSLVIADTAYLNLSQKENRYGIADILSISTALMDWDLARANGQDVISAAIWQRAVNVLEGILGIPPAEITDHLETVLGLVAEAGYITNDHGSGRPESGSEHIFASAIELRMPILHGAAVSLGIMIMTRAHAASTSIENYLTDLGMIDDLNELAIPRALALDALSTLSPRADRYTIVNKNHWRDNIEEMLNDIPVKFV
jgi:glycerol dehydrogenase-like iron-containing ADH family enzyme